MSHDTAGAKTGIVLKEDLCDLSKHRYLRRCRESHPCPLVLCRLKGRYSWCGLRIETHLRAKPSCRMIRIELSDLPDKSRGAPKRAAE